MARYADKGTVNVFLPGDRDLYAFSMAVARDNRPESMARWAAYKCTARKDTATLMWERPWKCTHWEPCIYCGALR